MFKFTSRGTRYIESDGRIIHKECTGCKTVKLIEEFGVNKSEFAGVQSKCKQCRSLYHQRNKQEIKLKERERSRFKSLLKVSDYEEKIIDTFGSLENFETYLAEKKRAKINARNKKWYWENRDNQLQRRKDYVEKNKDVINKYAKFYYKKNRLAKIIQTHNRRAIKSGVEFNLTEEQLVMMLEHFDYKCSISGSSEFELDHVIPIGIGKVGNVIGNVIPLSCELNSSKGLRNIFEWFNEVKYELDLSEDRFGDLINYISSINGMTVEEYKNFVYSCFESEES